MEFKRTLRVDADGDININENKEVTMLDGVPGVVQELKTLLQTPQGDDPFNPEFGIRLDEIVGAAEPVLDREIRHALDYDDRVRTIDEVDIQSGGRPRTRDVFVRVTLADPANTEVQFGVRFDE